MSTTNDRDRDLTADEVREVPEVALIPNGARVLEVHSEGTYDGTRYDGIDPSALYDCFFYCSGRFDELAIWLEHRLLSLGWPPGVDVDSAPVGDIKLAWRQWSWGKEHVDLFDFTQSTWTQFPRPPEGWSLVRLNYYRQPARDFTTDGERQAWLEDGTGKGERWRNRTADS